MVVFTCNNCGDSLQKPKVDKHYSTICRTFKNLTCVDCLQDFKGEDYSAHIKCVSEKERYAAKGSVVNAVNKGEVKQQQWSDMVVEFMNCKTSLTQPQKIIFEIMSGHILNVPRKKMKYLNFVKNAGGNRIMYSDIENVWDMIEEYKVTQHKEMAKQNEKTDEAVNITKKKKKSGSELLAPEENGQGPEEPIKPKKKKLKNLEPCSQTLEDNQFTTNKTKVKSNDEESVATLSNVDSEVTQEIVQIKSKKRKSEIRDNAILEMQTEESIAVKKNKKSKIVQDNVTDVTKPQDSECPHKPSAVNGSLNEDGPKKKKKKNVLLDGKDENKTDGEVDTEVQSLQEINGYVKEDGIDNGQDKNLNVTNDSVLNETGNTTTETLSRKILKMLKKKGNFRIAKLQKKVLKDYCQETGVEETAKLIKKFNKQLKKIEGVEISGDCVKLVSN